MSCSRTAFGFILCIRASRGMSFREYSSTHSDSRPSRPARPAS